MRSWGRRRVHEPPEIPNYDEPLCRGLLTDGLVIAVEPILASAPGRALESSDRWTILTEPDASPCITSTVVVRHGDPSS